MTALVLNKAMNKYLSQFFCVVAIQAEGIGLGIISSVKLLKRFDLFFSLHTGDILTEFFKLCCRKESTEEILGRGLTEESKGQVLACHI